VVDRRFSADLAFALRHQREMQAMIDRITRPTREMQAMIDRATRPTREMQAMIDRATRLTREMQAAIDQITRPTREMQAMIDQITRPTREMQAAMDQVFHLETVDKEETSPSPEDYVAATAESIHSIDVGSILAEEAPGFLNDPTGWLFEKDEAARQGDEQANQILLMVRHIYGCVLLFTRQLNPSIEAIERYSRALALMVFLTVCAGTLSTNNPSALAAINNVLTSPVGLLGVYLAVKGSKPSRPRRNKPSKSGHRQSRPAKRVLQRRRPSR
jgi:hypothetical protein